MRKWLLMFVAAVSPLACVTVYQSPATPARIARFAPKPATVSPAPEIGSSQLAVWTR
jgi:hypothetical protein